VFHSIYTAKTIDKTHLTAPIIQFISSNIGTIIEEHNFVDTNNYELADGNDDLH